jgi:hypothetical protein
MPCGPQNGISYEDKWRPQAYIRGRGVDSCPVRGSSMASPGNVWAQGVDDSAYGLALFIRNLFLGKGRLAYPGGIYLSLDMVRLE